MRYYQISYGMTIMMSLTITTVPLVAVLLTDMDIMAQVYLTVYVLIS